MLIAVDVREAATPHRAGKGEYTHHLVQALLSAPEGHEYLLLSDEAPYAIPAGASARVRRLRQPGWRWHLAAMSAALEGHADLFFAPTSYLIPALAPPSLPTVFTVCDLVAFLFADSHRRRSVEIEHATLGAAVRSSKRILAISEHTRRDLLERFPGAADKVDVTLLASAPVFARPHGAHEVEAARQRLGLPQRYVLAVGTLEPRKNLAFLARAHARARLQIPDLELVLVGKPGWGVDGFTAQLERLGTRGAVRFTGYLAQEDLPLVYAGARAFAFPSLYEGFGIPLLEAMASGCPVLSSNAASLPEVLGEAGLALSPADEAAWADGLARVDGDATLRADLIRRGRVRALEFRWADTARATLRAFTAALEG